MSRQQQSLFEGARMSLQDAIDYTAMSFGAYAENHKHWSVSFSGGKDSSATLAVTMYLIDAGLIKRPESLTVIYCDTGLELLPLHHTAMQIMAEVQKRGAKTIIVRPDMDKRFFVYMFGRGVPPPNPTFRYCTGNLKIAPMIKALKGIREQAGEKFLSLSGRLYLTSFQRQFVRRLNFSRFCFRYSALSKWIKFTMESLPINPVCPNCGGSFIWEEHCYVNGGYCCEHCGYPEEEDEICPCGCGGDPEKCVYSAVCPGCEKKFTGIGYAPRDQLCPECKARTVKND